MIGLKELIRENNGMSSHRGRAHVLGLSWPLSWNFLCFHFFEPNTELKYSHSVKKVSQRGIYGPFSMIMVHV